MRTLSRVVAVAILASLAAGTVAYARPAKPAVKPAKAAKPAAKPRGGDKKGGGKKGGDKKGGDEKRGGKKRGGKKDRETGRERRWRQIVEKAKAIDSRHFPYVWGGGHNMAFSGPYDCSGAVSAVLHAAGYLSRPKVAAEFMHWGKAGPGRVTIFASPSHVYMRIGRHYFGTSSANSHGGAGFFDGERRAGFVVRHVPLG